MLLQPEPIVLCTAAGMTRIILTLLLLEFTTVVHGHYSCNSDISQGRVQRARVRMCRTATATAPTLLSFSGACALYRAVRAACTAVTSGSTSQVGHAVAETEPVSDRLYSLACASLRVEASNSSEVSTTHVLCESVAVPSIRMHLAYIVADTSVVAISWTCALALHAVSFDTNTYRRYRQYGMQVKQLRFSKFKHLNIPVSRLRFDD
eukprot:20074-Heterococcus_DN1.PRE.1